MTLASDTCMGRLLANCSDITLILYPSFTLFCIDESSCLVFFWLLSVLPVQQLPMPGCWALTAAIPMQKFPGSVKLTCPKNQCHIMRRLENWKQEDLPATGYIYIPCITTFGRLAGPTYGVICYGRVVGAGLAYLWYGMVW